MKRIVLTLVRNDSDVALHIIVPPGFCYCGCANGSFIEYPFTMFVRETPDQIDALLREVGV
jgi:hypothetical protein